MPWTYAGPSASEIAEALPGSSRKPSARGWWTLRGFCHGSGEKRGSTSLSIADREDGQGVSVACFRGCDRPTIIAALEHTTGWTLQNTWTRDDTRAHTFPQRSARVPGGRAGAHTRPQPAQTTRTADRTATRGDGKARDTTDLAQRIWSAAGTGLSEDGHPARLWLAARQLWRADVPLPSALRWRSFSKGPARAGGAIIACFAPLDAWRTARPEPPTPTAVECIFIDGAGKPTTDRPPERGGREKRTYGARQGTACVLGEADLAGSVAVVEGIADGLAVAARRPGPVVVCAGTAGLRNDALADALAQAESVSILADNDQDGAGVDAAHHLRESLQLRGVSAAVLMNSLFKDAADVASRGAPFPDVDGELLADEAERLRSEGRTDPEALRLAAILLS